jgi:hypothetical protein
MKTSSQNETEFHSAKKAVEEIHKFYLILFVYIVMLVYLHWIDLNDGHYDWAYWPALGFSLSLIWFAVVMLPSKMKDCMIRSQLFKTEKLKENGMKTQENYSLREYEAAKKLVEEKVGFYIHLSAYCLINLFLVILCVIQGGELWAIWPILGWGIGLLFHGLQVYRMSSTSHWKEKQIRKEIEKQRRLKENL